jgi:hypothetical protein
LWVVPEAKHNRSIDVATHRYHRRIARFFQQHLASGRRGSTVLPLEHKLPTRRVG